MPLPQAPPALACSPGGILSLPLQTLLPCWCKAKADGFRSPSPVGCHGGEATWSVCSVPCGAWQPGGEARPRRPTAPSPHPSLPRGTLRDHLHGLGLIPEQMLANSGP